MKNREQYVMLLQSLIESIKEGKTITMVNAVDTMLSNIKSEEEGVSLEYFVDGQGWIKTAEFSSGANADIKETIIGDLESYKVNEEVIFNPDIVEMCNTDGEVTAESLKEFEKTVREEIPQDNTNEEKPDSDIINDVNEDIDAEKKKSKKESKEDADNVEEDDDNESSATLKKVGIGIAGVAIVGAVAYWGFKAFKESLPTATVVDID